jgi:hypothetical protein
MAAVSNIRSHGCGCRRHCEGIQVAGMLEAWLRWDD